MFFLLLTTVLMFFQYQDSLARAKADLLRPPMPLTFAKWSLTQEGSPGFASYSAAVFAEAKRLMMKKVMIVKSLGILSNAVLGALSVFLIAASCSGWANFSYSRKLVLRAWYLSVAAPFIVSMVPCRIWLEWENAEDLLNAYQTELSAVVGVDGRVRQLHDNCVALRDTGHIKVDKAVDVFHSLCGLVDKLPHGKAPIPTGFFKISMIDLEPAHRACTQGRAMIKAGKPQEALEKAKEVCARIEDKVDEAMESYGETPEIVSYMCDKLRRTAEASIGVYLGLLSLGSIFPAALSIAPGLMKGALRMKMVVPQSNIPGMFVIILPWLYCPLTWCMYSIFFQLIGNTVLLVALAIMAFSPAIYCILGSYYNLDKPLRDHELAVVIKAMDGWNSTMNYVAYVCLAYFAFHVINSYASQKSYWGILGEAPPEELADWGTKTESQFLADMYEGIDLVDALYTNSISISAFVCSFVKSLYLTSLAGLDWMVGQMIEFRRVERSVNRPGVVGADILRDYHVRMDYLVALDKGIRNMDYSKD